MSLELEEKQRRVLDPEWVEHPFTRKLRDGIKRDFEVAYQVLVSAAANSTDPAVRAAYMRMRVLGDTLDTFDQGIVKEETGEGAEDDE
jgi:hypothetical protein